MPIPMSARIYINLKPCKTTTDFSCYSRIVGSPNKRGQHDRLLHDHIRWQYGVEFIEQFDRSNPSIKQFALRQALLPQTSKTTQRQARSIEDTSAAQPGEFDRPQLLADFSCTSEPQQTYRAQGRRNRSAVEQIFILLSLVSPCSFPLLLGLQKNKTNHMDQIKRSSDASGTCDGMEPFW